MIFWLAISLAPAAQAFCFNEAGAIYQIDPTLLKAIAQQESRLSAKAVNSNRDKRGRVLSVDDGLMRDKRGRVLSVDDGLMQVNSTHIPRLQKMGVLRHPEDLLHQPCLNVKIGAWILARHLRACGVNWACLGSYNAGFHRRHEKKRLHYAQQVYAHYWPVVSGDRRTP
ncbi:lytic transglycosylase [Candidatus Williamhamiltonella defendens]|uniref:Lytic transglycosylase n=1 Tax=Candidatus Williamhamiltonella defendens TaxID=138072 RepID=A0A2D3TA49_9ENTR|nr:lytic transglycosylase domain-containing protein [Candidatus Hamiltonella defensa]ATW30690.1 lytic transglycosylase [Candidatus Hamiltonella defensa]ATW32677.1 lytic transglycosylase [Candidatus Hamiltonella defensa]